MALLKYETYSGSKEQWNKAAKGELAEWRNTKPSFYERYHSQVLGGGDIAAGEISRYGRVLSHNEREMVLQEGARAARMLKAQAQLKSAERVIDGRELYATERKGLPVGIATMQERAIVPVRSDEGKGKLAEKFYEKYSKSAVSAPMATMRSRDYISEGYTYTPVGQEVSAVTKTVREPGQYSVTTIAAPQGPFGRPQIVSSTTERAPEGYEFRYGGLEGTEYTTHISERGVYTKTDFITKDTTYDNPLDNPEADIPGLEWMGNVPQQVSDVMFDIGHPAKTPAEKMRREIDLRRTIIGSQIIAMRGAEGFLEGAAGIGNLAIGTAQYTARKIADYGVLAPYEIGKDVPAAVVAMGAGAFTTGYSLGADTVRAISGRMSTSRFAYNWAGGLGELAGTYAIAKVAPKAAKYITKKISLSKITPDITAKLTVVKKTKNTAWLTGEYEGTIETRLGTKIPVKGELPLMRTSDVGKIKWTTKTLQLTPEGDIVNKIVEQKFFKSSGVSDISKGTAKIAGSEGTQIGKSAYGKSAGIDIEIAKGKIGGIKFEYLKGTPSKSSVSAFGYSEHKQDIYLKAGNEYLKLTKDITGGNRDYALTYMSTVPSAEIDYIITKRGLSGASKDFLRLGRYKSTADTIFKTEVFEPVKIVDTSIKARAMKAAKDIAKQRPFPEYDFGEGKYVTTEKVSKDLVAFVKQANSQRVTLSPSVQKAAVGLSIEQAYKTFSSGMATAETRTGIGLFSAQLGKQGTGTMSVFDVKQAVDRGISQKRSQVLRQAVDIKALQKRNISNINATLGRIVPRSANRMFISTKSVTDIVQDIAPIGISVPSMAKSPIPEPTKAALTPSTYPAEYTASGMFVPPFLLFKGNIAKGSQLSVPKIKIKKHAPSVLGIFSGIKAKKRRTDYNPLAVRFI